MKRVKNMDVKEIKGPKEEKGKRTWLVDVNSRLC